MRRLLLSCVVLLAAWRAYAISIHVGMTGAVKKQLSDLSDNVAQARAAAVLAGTAAHGLPLGATVVTIKDCSGGVSTATTTLLGSFSLSDGAITYPALLRVPFAGGALYGVAFGPGTNNVHPLTDAVIRTFYRSGKGIVDLDARYNANFSSLCGLPVQDSVTPIKSMITTMLAPALTRDGLDPSTFDPLTAQFNADGTGFDKVLDEVQVSTTPTFSSFAFKDTITNTTLATVAPAQGDNSTPNPPTNLSAATVTSSTVTLTWTLSGSANVAGYGVFRDGVQVAVSTTNAFTDVRRLPGTVYRYSLKTFTWTGNASAPTTALAVTTLVPLSVQKLGLAGGTVTSSPAGINCGAACAADFALNAAVTLTATPDATSIFLGWGGACSGTGACSVTMDAVKAVTARFFSTTMTVTKTGTGTGTVASAPAGISCGAACSFTFTANTSVTLTPTPDPGSVLTAWSGACTGSGACVVAMNDAKAVGAQFDLNTLTVALTGNGAGTVTSAPGGISCGATCAANFNSGTPVTLTPAPSAGSVFSGWSGACTGTGACVVTMNGAKNVTANFTLNTLSVSQTGTGSGTVTSAPAGISCGATCSANFNAGAVVTLTTAATSGSLFTGWSGACAGLNVCVVTMNGAQAVTARFDRNTLTVSNTGLGSGSVASTPAGISCGATCAADFALAASVTLTPSAAPGSIFGAWGGACAGSGACVVAMNGPQTVTARFDAINTLSVTAAGSGSVGSVPAGIDCGGTCSASFTSATTVILTTNPAAGFVFAGWTGACGGTGQCAVSMSQARSVTAHFLPPGITANSVNFTGPFPAAGDVHYTDPQTNLISTVTAYPGQVQVFFDTNSITAANAASALTSRGAAIIGQIPLVGYYLAQVAQGSEGTFISSVNQMFQVKLALPNLALKDEDGVIIDGSYVIGHTLVPIFTPPPPSGGNPLPQTPAITQVDLGDGGQHAVRVGVAAQNGGSPFTNVIDNSQIRDANGNVASDSMVGVLVGLTQGQSQPGYMYVNMSNGAGYRDANGNWADVSLANAQDHVRAENNRYADWAAKLQAIANLPADLRANVVFAFSAGNNNMDVEPVLARLRLNPTFSQILDRNVLIVGTNRHIDPSFLPDPRFPNGIFSNHAVAGDPDFVNCDNAEASDTVNYGTSFAAPACLAFIRQIVQQTGVTPSQALQAAKRAALASGTKTMTLAAGQAAATTRPFVANYSCQVTNVINCRLVSDPDAPDPDDANAPSLANLPLNPVTGQVANLPDCQASAVSRASQDCTSQVNISPDGDDLWTCNIQFQPPTITNCVQQP